MLEILSIGNHIISLKNTDKIEEIRRMRLYELKQKEVINIKSCRSLGCVSDLDIDCKSGCVLALIVPGPGKLCWFLGREFEYVIPWRCIVQIGADIILVDIQEEELRKKCG
jgi:YlmC/YmxH family sporulation protein